MFTPGTKYEPIPLPDRLEVPVEEMRRRAKTFFDDMCARHTVRDYSPQSVPRDIIEEAIRTAGRAPSGANYQPWHFVAVADAGLKRRIREAAEDEERAFYTGRAGDEWLHALEPIGTNHEKPFLETAPWIIVVFAQRYGVDAAKKTFKNYYVAESVGIATGFLITALHNARLATLVHTPNPMKFLNELCARPANEKPYAIIVTGYAGADAMIPKAATNKKPLEEIVSFL